MVNDPIADMLTRIRNAIMAHHDSVQVPASRIKLAIAKILKDEGFIADYTVLKGKPERIIKISLKYINGRPAIAGLERASKPGLRLYVGGHEIPRVYGGLGITVLSTSKGVMIGEEAWHKNIGGELLCFIW
jgi:small subunit ribosomal protein S8